MTTQVIITFKNDEEAQYLVQYIERAKQQDGTVTGVYAGVMCSALKHCLDYSVQFEVHEGG